MVSDQRTTLFCLHHPIYTFRTSIENEVISKHPLAHCFCQSVCICMSVCVLLNKDIRESYSSKWSEFFQNDIWNWSRRSKIHRRMTVSHGLAMSNWHPAERVFMRQMFISPRNTIYNPRAEKFHKEHASTDGTIEMVRMRLHSNYSYTNI